MVAHLSDDELAAYFALRAAGDRMQRAVTQQLRSYGLTEVQFSILAQVDAAPTAWEWASWRGRSWSPRVG